MKAFDAVMVTPVWEGGRGGGRVEKKKKIKKSGRTNYSEPITNRILLWKEDKEKKDKDCSVQTHL